MTRTPKVIVKRARDKQLYFVVEGRNGRIICTSELYKSKAGIRKNIVALSSALSSLDLTITWPEPAKKKSIRK